ncbi:hypothetical protein KW785_02430 [Candidatus Parcubacteria bacterium]|nr:hypothetical protein [Candidatus Parcubacteria bacterium]
MTSNSKFEKSLESLRKVSLTSKERSAVSSTLAHYVEVHPAVTEEHYFAALQRMFRSALATISWK